MSWKKTQCSFVTFHGMLFEVLPHWMGFYPTELLLDALGCENTALAGLIKFGLLLTTFFWFLENSQEKLVPK